VTLFQSFPCAAEVLPHPNALRIFATPGQAGVPESVLQTTCLRKSGMGSPATAAKRRKNATQGEPWVGSGKPSSPSGAEE